MGYNPKPCAEGGGGEGFSLLGGIGRWVQWHRRQLVAEKMILLPAGGTLRVDYSFVTVFSFKVALKFKIEEWPGKGVVAMSREYKMELDFSFTIRRDDLKMMFRADRGKAQELQVQGRRGSWVWLCSYWGVPSTDLKGNKETSSVGYKF